MLLHAFIHAFKGSNPTSKQDKVVLQNHEFLSMITCFTEPVQGLGSVLGLHSVCVLLGWTG